MMSCSYRGSLKMPSSQNFALNCNSRWRYKGSKFDSTPYKPFKICSSSFSLEPTQNQRDLYGAVLNFHPLYFGWELQLLRGNFWQGPLFKDALFENGAKSHNFTNLFFCDVTLQDSIVVLFTFKIFFLTFNTKPSKSNYLFLYFATLGHVCKIQKSLTVNLSHLAFSLWNSHHLEKCCSSEFRTHTASKVQVLGPRV